MILFRRGNDEADEATQKPLGKPAYIKKLFMHNHVEMMVAKKSEEAMGYLAEMSAMQSLSINACDKKAFEAKLQQHA